MATISAEELKTELGTIKNWSSDSKSITRTFTFTDFPEAIRFVDKIAVQAERANHHPDIDIRWNKVKLLLTTHDSGGLTAKDFSLAREADKLG